jgi:hypothetical protein
MVWVGLAPAVQARDLPQGGFMLVDTPLSGIAEGEIVPVFLHVEITATRLDWTFITGFMPFDQSCEMYQKCQQSVQTLSHEVDWQADGTLAILKTERRRGAELTIDRPAEDEIFVYEALSLFLDGAVLDLDASGGLLRREPQEGKQEGETVVRLLPATLDHGLAALAFARAFELPLALLDHCVIRQVVGFAAMAEPDPLTQEVLLAARFLRYLDTLDLEAHFYSGEPPAEKGFDVQMAKLRGTAARFTLGTVSQMYGDAARSGAVPPTDADALVAATQIIARLQKRLGDFYGVVVEEIVQTRGQELLAAARFEARRAAVSEASQEAMIARVCTDARLP